MACCLYLFEYKRFFVIFYGLNVSVKPQPALVAVGYA